MKALSLLIKPASGHCNLRCKYCFYVDVVSSRDEKNYGMMSLETLEKLIKSAFAEVTQFCSIGFQGGEPTLAGLSFYRALIKFVKKYNQKGVKVAYSVQTNGLLLDDEWAGFLAENKFLVGLSIDAGKSVHDGMRIDTNGKGTHSKCLQAARLLEKHKVDFNILSVVSKGLAAHPDKAWQFYKQHGFRHIQFIPCLGALSEDQDNPHLPSAQIYGKFLCRIFDLWYKDLADNNYVSVRAFDNYVQMLAGFAPENCAMSGICNVYGLVEANGNVYPCDFYAVDEYLLGNIHTHTFEGMLTDEVANSFAAPSKEADSHCKDCEHFFICRGGCRRDREPAVNGKLSLNRFCKAYKVFFSYALPRMISIAKSVPRNRHTV